ncbi:MAG: extracellular solute-binding protein, partial [bacterium]|nr:extracellular solute-binding protein [bacterium]
MKEQLTQFQIILLAIFGFFIVAGVLFFALYRGGAGQDLPPLVLWGTYPKQMMDSFLGGEVFQGQPIKFTYVEKDEATLDQEFTKALADGAGPDLLILPQNLLIKEQSRLVTIDQKTLSERNFKDIFIEGSELFLGGNGALGIPFSVDPLVMYWNRTLFTNAGLPEPPKTWDQFFALVPKLTEYDQGGNIRKSAVALGSFQNITNAKEILATLLLQAGTSIVSIVDGKLVVVLQENSGGGASPAESATAFYTGFSDAAKGNYSWNRAQPSSSRAFVDGTLATYFGFSSELPQIRQKNPNLNFDVAPLPQLKNAKTKQTYGKFTAVVIPRQAKSPPSSLNGAALLTSAPILTAFAEASGLPPVRRD